jgi:hypothetical protein
MVLLPPITIPKVPSRVNANEFPNGLVPGSNVLS